jgi:hypothetical protein
MAVTAAAEEDDDMLQPISTGDLGRKFLRPIITLILILTLIGDWDNDLWYRS